MSEITDFSGFYNSNIRRVRNYWLIKPVWTGLNQFMWSCQKLLINKTAVVTQKVKFLWFPTYLHLNIICHKITLHNPMKLFYDFQSRCSDVWDICRFFKGKIPEKFHPLTSIGQNYWCCYFNLKLVWCFCRVSVVPYITVQLWLEFVLWDSQIYWHI